MQIVAKFARGISWIAKLAERSQATVGIDL